MLQKTILPSSHTAFTSCCPRKGGLYVESRCSVRIEDATSFDRNTATNAGGEERFYQEYGFHYARQRLVTYPTFHSIRK